MTVVFNHSSRVCIDLDPSHQEQLWQRSQESHPSPTSVWQAYLNYLCLQGVLPWLKDSFQNESQHPGDGEGIRATPSDITFNGLDDCDHRLLHAIWDVVSGMTIVLGMTRFILIPSEDIDLSEFRVPQEWIDIPSWVGDYYLAVQVNPDEGQVWIWGYTTHDDLKQRGHYDGGDRTYRLDSEEIVTDLSVLRVIQHVCADETKRAPLPALPALSPTQVNALMQRLGQSTVVMPRLEVPFGMWGALIENEIWRSRLYQTRRQVRWAQPQSVQPQSEQLSSTIVPINLRQWIQAVFSGARIEGDWGQQGWQEANTFMPSSPDLAMAFRRDDSLNEESMGAGVRRGKRLILDVESEIVSVLLLMTVDPKTNGRVGIRVQLCPDVSVPTLPDGIELALLSPIGEVVQAVQGRSLDSFIQLKRFRLPADTSFILRVTLKNVVVTESFTT